MNLIANLQDEDLKNSITENIYKAIINSKNASITIKFIFKIQNDPNWKAIEKIENFAYIKYKNVYFKGVDIDTAIKIIVNNFTYNCFSYKDEKYINGKIKCHGFRENWGEDNWIFTYIRYNEI